MSIKNLYFVSIIFLAFFITGCGHNVLTDYEVNGLDMSLPIAGIPFGIRIGAVKVNTNLIRGNASFTNHNNIGADIDGIVQKNNIIQFSSNTQFNEGNILDFLRNPDIDDATKKEFILTYFNEAYKAPELLPASSKLLSSLTTTNTDIDSHTMSVEKTKVDGPLVKLVNGQFLLSILGDKISSILNAGNAVATPLILVVGGALVVLAIAAIIIIVYVIKLLIKLFKWIYTKVKSNFKKKAEATPLEEQPTKIIEDDQNVI